MADYFDILKEQLTQAGVDFYDLSHAADGWSFRSWDAPQVVAVKLLRTQIEIIHSVFDVEDGPVYTIWIRQKNPT